jgi:O-Antigen ligase
MPIKGLKLHGRRLRLAIVAASAFVALIAAISSIYEIQLLPPSIQKRDLQLGVAATNAIVDYHSESDGASIADLVSYNDLEAMTERTEPLARLMTSEALLDRIGKQVGVDPSQISATTQVTQSAPRSLIEPDNERRAAGILGEQASYRIEAQAEPNLPVLGIYAEAPTAAEATSLADTAVEALNVYLRDQGRKEGTPATAVVHLTQLGAARGGPVDATAPWKIAALTFVVVFGACCGLAALIAAVRRGWRRGSRPTAAVRAAGEAVSTRLRSAPLLPTTPDRDRPRRDDWPHTTRLLPWMIAGFIAMLWLVPFNGVLLNASLPIDLNLDRLVLPVIVLTWVVALAAGGPGAPRWRFTPIHAALAAFALVAGLSVVLNADALDRTLVLDLSVKKLTLLVAYLSFFVVVASAVRPAEVPAFLKYMLGLAVICAICVIWEYRTGFNIFYDLTTRALPGVFQAPVYASTFDELGRRAVVGPTELGLEVVAILSMAFPIAIVGIMHAKRWRGRILYGIAVCILGLAMLSTYRKSALLAPVTVGLALAYFRPRQALKLAPLGAVVIAVMAIAGFSAFQSVTGQFETDRLDVGTVNDRVADYDAVRPDFLSHPALGQGFGSYENFNAPADNRILDSELLLRVVETGIIGLAVFLLVIGTVIVVAAGILRRGDPLRAPAALAIGPAAAAFLCCTSLFDEWSFPHAVYVFLTLAGLLAVLVRSADEETPSARPAAGLGTPDRFEHPEGIEAAARPLPRTVV